MNDEAFRASLRRRGTQPHVVDEIAAAVGQLELYLAQERGRDKGIRARLYHDAGVDTIEKLAAWEPDALRLMLEDFVSRTGFEGVAPLPKEVRKAVATARKLPRIVEWQIAAE